MLYIATKLHVVVILPMQLILHTSTRIYRILNDADAQFRCNAYLKSVRVTKPHAFCFTFHSTCVELLEIFRHTTL